MGDAIKVFGGGLVILVIMMTILINATEERDRNLAQWIKDNGCELVESIPGSSKIVPVISLNNGQMGMGISGSSGKDGYLCDDGVVHYR